MRDMKHLVEDLASLSEAKGERTAEWLLKSLKSRLKAIGADREDVSFALEELGDEIEDLDLDDDDDWEHAEDMLEACFAQVEAPTVVSKMFASERRATEAAFREPTDTEEDLVEKVLDGGGTAKFYGLKKAGAVGDLTDKNADRAGGEWNSYPTSVGYGILGLHSESIFVSKKGVGGWLKFLACGKRDAPVSGLIWVGKGEPDLGSAKGAAAKLPADPQLGDVMYELEEAGMDTGAD